MRRDALSKIAFASGLSVESAPTVLRKIPIGCASYRNPSMNFLMFSCSIVWYVISRTHV